VTLAAVALAAPSRALASLCALVALAACGGPGFMVPIQAQPDYAPAVEVPEPAPAARIEYVTPTPPEQSCRWVDGRWAWQGAGWRWEAGRWVYPPALCYYSLPALNWAARGTSGVLYYRPGRWYSSVEPRICPEPPRCGPELPDPSSAPNFVPP
jgi:hypothetical protein